MEVKKKKLYFRSPMQRMCTTINYFFRQSNLCQPSVLLEPGQGFAGERSVCLSGGNGPPPPFPFSLPRPPLDATYE